MQKVIKITSSPEIGSLKSINSETRMTAKGEPEKGSRRKRMKPTFNRMRPTSKEEFSFQTDQNNKNEGSKKPNINEKIENENLFSYYKTSIIQNEDDHQHQMNDDRFRQ